MTEYSMNASVRDNAAGGRRRELLKKGLIPAVVYGKAIGSMPLEINQKEMYQALHEGKNTIINLSVAGNGGPYKVMVKELQYDPVKRGIIHADFQQISMQDTIATSVQVVVAGQVLAGMAQLVLHNLEISCLPAMIPGQVPVDVSGMKPGDSIEVGDLKLPEGVKVLTGPDITVVTVLAPGEAAEAPGAVAENAGEPVDGTEH